MLKTLKNLGDLKGKKVLTRVDFNVPIMEGAVPISAEWRIRAVLPTLDYLLQRGAKIIILSHLGRPQGADLHYSLYPVYLKLKDLWGQEVLFSHDIFGSSTPKTIKTLKNSQAVLLENLRFYDGEEKNDENFAKDLAGLGDIYINDAFAVSHRAHASIVGLPKLLPSSAGLLLEKEITMLSMVRDKPRRPLVLVMGGAKAETKLKLVSQFLDKSEGIIVGGILANTILYARGMTVGRSVIEESLLDEAKKLEITSTHLHLPVDVLVSKSLNIPSDIKIRPVGKIEPDEYIVDIGPDTIKLFKKIIKDARMVVWNGAVGLSEIPAFKNGSAILAQTIANLSGEKIIGGGDLVSFLSQENLFDKMTYVSTGGGAMLEFLAGEILPGISALEE
ncbi:MAG: phosphoglycerate kinase [Patescibacteria group bacterium]